MLAATRSSCLPGRLGFLSGRPHLRSVASPGSAQPAGLVASASLPRANPGHVLLPFCSHRLRAEPQNPKVNSENSESDFYKMLPKRRQGWGGAEDGVGRGGAGRGARSAGRQPGGSECVVPPRRAGLGSRGVTGPGTGQPVGKARPHEPRGFQLACASEDTVRPHGPEGEKPHTSKSRVRTK